MTSKELVYNTLNMSSPERIPRQLWLLPWATNEYADEVNVLKRDYPDDIVHACAELKEIPSLVKGNPYEVGEFVDDFGCIFTNVNRGIIGEVKTPLVKDDEWEDVDNVHIPYEWLSFDIEQVNDFIKTKAPDKFVLSGACPRPFERLQFIRGTANLYCDLMYKPDKMMCFISKLHSFYCELLEKWAKTDVDALTFMDDWGSQKALLINPLLWREIFMPMYKDYIDIAKKYGKKTFMHSDGYTLDILPDLIDMGLDAINTQIFCMGIKNLSRFKGKITFWGEIDRQHIIPKGTRKDNENAVKEIFETLYANGGLIAQCEFGPGGKPENIHTIFKTFNNILI